MVSHVAVVVGCILFACGSLALGQEHSVEFRGCLITETTIIDRAGDVIIGLNVTRGITDRIGPGPFPEKTSHDCRVVFNASKAGVEFSNRCNFVDADGDKILSVADGTRDSFRWKWIAGTGKFQGISGTGTAKVEGGYPRMQPTVTSSCWTGKGTYSINK